ncbi:MAG: TylF/MycF/NovP-related O-methyltransferase, partial [Candidatus Desantisbacteria bacterium]
EVNSYVDIHKKGDFSDVTIEGVQDYLKKYSNCHFHKGIFPGTTRELADDIEFCFVHLDVDIYESTLSGLNFFYPRLKKGGIIISHDYNLMSCPGVRKAFDEFFIDKSDEVIVLWDTQCMVRKQG